MHNQSFETNRFLLVVRGYLPSHPLRLGAMACRPAAIRADVVPSSHCFSGELLLAEGPAIRNLPIDLPKAVHAVASRQLNLHALAPLISFVSPNLPSRYVASCLFAGGSSEGMTPDRTGNDDDRPYHRHTLVSLVGIRARPDLPSDLTEILPNKAFQK